MNITFFILLPAAIILQDTKIQYKLNDISTKSGFEAVKSIAKDLNLDLEEVNFDHSFILTKELDYNGGFAGSEFYKGRLLFEFRNECMVISWKDVMFKDNITDWHRIESMGPRGAEFLEQIFMIIKMTLKN